MSHFLVGVITYDNLMSVDEVLAPYSEYLEVEPYVAQTKEEAIQQAKYVQKRVKERLAEENREANEFEAEILPLETDDEFYEFATAGEELDEEGNILSTYNPLSKWDWYEIGGRWSGELRLKDGTRADSAPIKDIDFSPNHEVYEAALKYWDDYVLRQGNEEDFQYNIHSREYYLKNYTREEFAKQRATVYTRAIVTPYGEWIEVGQMGWWATSSETEEERKEWIAKWYDTFIKDEDPNAVFTIVDCHI